MVGVTKDATSGIFVPASLSEWSQTLQVAGIGSGAPSLGWGCQDAAGPLAEFLGGGTVTLAATGAVTFQQTVTGWSRKAVGLQDAATEKFSSTAAALPDISTTSALLLVYMDVLATPAAVRVLSALGTTNAKMDVTTVPQPRTDSNVNTATGTGGFPTSPIPLVLKVDRTNTVVRGYTLADKMAPTFDATMTGKSLTLGGLAANAASSQYLYAVLFTGAAAELTDAQIKTLLQTLGWTITWT